MANKIFYFIVGLAAVFYSPWWLALGLIIVLASVGEPFYPALGPALLFDWFYGLAGGWPLALIVVTFIGPLALFLKRLIRLN